MENKEYRIVKVETTINTRYYIESKYSNDDIWHRHIVGDRTLEEARYFKKLLSDKDNEKTINEEIVE